VVARFSTAGFAPAETPRVVVACAKAAWTGLSSELAAAIAAG